MVVQIKNYILRCANEEPLRYTANQNIPVSRHFYILSGEKIIDLPYHSTCPAT